MSSLCCAWKIGRGLINGVNKGINESVSFDAVASWDLMIKRPWLRTPARQLYAGISRVMEPRIAVRSKRFVEVDGSRTSASLMPRLRSNRTRNRAPVSPLAATSLPKGFSIITFIYVNGFIARLLLPCACLYRSAAMCVYLVRRITHVISQNVFGKRVINFSNRCHCK